MSVERPVSDLLGILTELRKLPHETEWAEFKHNNDNPEEIRDFPEKERELWRVFDRTPFEKEIAAENIATEDVLQLLDFPAYFDLLSLPPPERRDGILSALASDDMIAQGEDGKWNITNLGATLFAKRLAKFRTLARKVVRVVLYKGENRMETVCEQECDRGYAAGFKELLGLMINLLPSNEVIGQALRRQAPMFPELAIRELVANAIIHQDFHLTGTGPMVEIFAGRMEITSPGLPLVQTERFLDSPPRSRNEALASFMRRIGVCEERGSGIDKVVAQTELFQLPAPLFEATNQHTRATLFAHREFREMDRTDRIRACYLHACLRYVQRDYMTNTTLRERFGIDEKNSSVASRIIRDTIEAGLIIPYDEDAGRKYMKYLPRWAR